ncbi:hypothetical protein QA802_34450 [Streptomyces sp. B21-105]|uniref:hypothetical protein n=1 Tax=Streptomyces sp. B21-105 TaxID=3039417 RepID=UPI002FEFA26E
MSTVVAGWRLLVPSYRACPNGACWTRTEQGWHLLLDVDLRPKGFSPEPEVGTGLAYSVSVGTERDGGKETCWH